VRETFVSLFFDELLRFKPFPRSEEEKGAAWLVMLGNHHGSLGFEETMSSTSRLARARYLLHCLCVNGLNLGLGSLMRCWTLLEEDWKAVLESQETLRQMQQACEVNRTARDQVVSAIQSDLLPLTALRLLTLSRQAHSLETQRFLASKLGSMTWLNSPYWRARILFELEDLESETLQIKKWFDYADLGVRNSGEDLESIRMLKGAAHSLLLRFADSKGLDSFHLLKIAEMIEQWDPATLESMDLCGLLHLKIYRSNNQLLRHAKMAIAYDPILKNSSLQGFEQKDGSEAENKRLEKRRIEALDRALVERLGLSPSKPGDRETANAFLGFIPSYLGPDQECPDLAALKTAATEQEPAFAHLDWESIHEAFNSAPHSNLIEFISSLPTSSIHTLEGVSREVHLEAEKSRGENHLTSPSRLFFAMQSLQSPEAKPWKMALIAIVSLLLIGITVGISNRYFYERKEQLYQQAKDAYLAQDLSTLKNTAAQLSQRFGHQFKAVGEVKGWISSLEQIQNEEAAHQHFQTALRSGDPDIFEYARTLMQSEGLEPADSKEILASIDAWTVREVIELVEQGKPGEAKLLLELRGQILP